MLWMLWMCNQKTTNGQSVNDIQHTGPKLQKSMPTQIIKMRMFEFVTTGDISKMFWQIHMNQEDQAYQHTYVILEKKGKLVEKVMPMMIFGLNSSPFLALATMLQLAKDVEEEFPEAAKLLKHSFYVDDLLQSFPTKEQATEAFRQLKLALKKGGFQIRKCASNCKEVLRFIDPEDHLTSVVKEIDCSEKEISDVNVLGIKWNRVDDYLHYTIRPTPLTGAITWRSALSFIAQIFDSPGFLLPVIMTLRIIIQEICMKVQSKAGENETDKQQRKRIWDTPVDEETSKKFTDCTKDMKVLEQIKIPRWIKCTDPQTGDDQLIVFFDASMKAYGFVVYWRHVPFDTNYDVSVTLLGAGGRVASLAQKRKEKYNSDEITLPKNELNSADEAAKYVKKLKTEIYIPNHVEIWGFGDSTVVNAWFNTPINKLTVYVANRVRRVLESFEVTKLF